MFGLFKKKKEEPVQEAAPVSEQEQSQEVKTFAADFPGEETDILAVTAPAAVGSEKVGDSGLWKVTIGLTAWQDEYTHELRQGDARLEAVVDDKLREYLHTRVPGNFIITATVRPSEDGTRFLMTDLPKPGFDPELKAILEEQKKPVTLEVEGLGTFTLNRSLGWFESAVDWQGAEVSLTFDQAEETRDAAQDTARALLDEQESWDERVRAYAADTLLDRANELLGEDEDAESITREDFLAQLEPDSILAGPAGAFEFWFGGDDLFLAHPVHVTGTLEDGPQQAEID
ncbi:MAG: DUF2262 domain-containing protein [Oscillospiraceae bacterium]